MKIFDLTGRVAFVTGASRGIGFAIAKGLKEAGATVWVHARNEKNIADVAKENGFKYTYGDLADMAAVEKIAADISAQEERLDILFNNAGFEIHSPVDEMTESDLNMMYNINAKSPVFLVKGLLPLIKKSKAGSIINVTSIHQEVPVRENSYYCMAKAALGMYTKTAALELAKFNIRVNNLAPGAILTDMNRDLVEAMDFNKWIPMERVGETEELIGPAIFLASDASSYVTGATLFVDGGYKENLLRY
ncbi:MAG: SDR family oxidoreductase [Clostridium sp.]